MEASGGRRYAKSNTRNSGRAQTFNAVFGKRRGTRGNTALDACGVRRWRGAVALKTGIGVGWRMGRTLAAACANPASFCGIVGLRPSIGRVALWPAADPWANLSVEGPMARNVADLALFLDCAGRV